MLFAEVLTFVWAFSTISVWKPVRRGAQYFDEFELPFPDKLWSIVDVLLCHNPEHARDTVDTLMVWYNRRISFRFGIWMMATAKLSGQKATPFPTDELNKGIFEFAGDFRQDMVQYMGDCVCDPNEDTEVYVWLRLHSSAD